MPGAVQFVPLQQVGPALFAVLYREVGIQVAVFVLGVRDEVYQLVRIAPEGFVPAQREGIRGCFQPLVCVAVLEYHAVESVGGILAPEHLCGVDEILRHMALFRALRLIPEHAVLIRNDRIVDDVLVFFDESCRPVCGHWNLFLRFHVFPPGVLTMAYICIIIFVSACLNGEMYLLYGK